MKQTLLVELLTEELPPKALSKLGDAFAAAMLQGLTQRSLADADASVIAYASPRRLAVSIHFRVRQEMPVRVQLLDVKAHHRSPP